jgi:hypothetical protein
LTYLPLGALVAFHLADIFCTTFQGHFKQFVEVLGRLGRIDNDQPLLLEHERDRCYAESAVSA